MKTTYTRVLRCEGGLLVRFTSENHTTRLGAGTQVVVSHATWKPSSIDELLVTFTVTGRGVAAMFMLPSEIIRIFEPDRSTW